MNLSNLFGVKPKPFDVSSVNYKKTIDNQLVDKLSGYLQLNCKQLTKLGLSKIIVGIDGEINCLIACVLLKQALAENTMAMILDFGSPLTNSLVDFCTKSGIQTFILKRGKTYQDELSAYQLHKELDIRHFYKHFINYHLLIQAEQMKAALADTTDKSDRLLGTYPAGFYGHLMPFYSLYKSEVYDLAHFLNIPDQFISNTAIDPILFLLTEKQLSPEEISQSYNIDLHWLKKLKSQIDKQSLKTAVSQFII